MAKALRNIWALACIFALAGCQLSLPGSGGAKAPAGPNPVTGGEITVTPLDDPAPAPAPKPAHAPVEKPSAAVENPSDPAEKPLAGAKPSGAKPQPAATAEAPPAPEAAPEIPAEEKSAARLACEKRKGVWARAANGSHSCVVYTRDGGKACRKAGDCESECLARSGTCAPFSPLLGCNDILDDSGRRMTLCLD